MRFDPNRASRLEPPSDHQQHAPDSAPQVRDARPQASEPGHQCATVDVVEVGVLDVALVVRVEDRPQTGLLRLARVVLEDLVRLVGDRAALLAVQDPEVAVRVFMKMAGGSLSLFDEMDRDAFLDQIRAYEERDDSRLDRAYKFFITAFRTHPFPIMRAKHLDAWIHDGGFEGLCAGPAAGAGEPEEVAPGGEGTDDP